MSLADLNQPEPSRGQVFLKQSANIYTMLLILSFLAVAGTALACVRGDWFPAAPDCHVMHCLPVRRNVENISNG
jgi:hypothetical protein